MWRVVTYFICSYLMVAALALALTNRLRIPECPKSKRNTIIFRVIIGLFIILGVLAGAVTTSHGRFCSIPGELVLYTFYTDSGYASPLLIFALCLVVIAWTLRIFHHTRHENISKTRKARAFAVGILMLLPLIPYAVVEGQTLLFADRFAKFAGPDRFKVVSVSPRQAIIAIDNFHNDVCFLELLDGHWLVQRVMQIRGEYIGVFPPYSQFDW